MEETNQSVGAPVESFDEFPFIDAALIHGAICVIILLIAIFLFYRYSRKQDSDSLWKGGVVTRPRARFTAPLNMAILFCGPSVLIPSINALLEAVDSYTLPSGAVEYSVYLFFASIVLLFISLVLKARIGSTGGEDNEPVTFSWGTVGFSQGIAWTSVIHMISVIVFAVFLAFQIVPQLTADATDKEVAEPVDERAHE